MRRNSDDCNESFIWTLIEKKKLRNPSDFVWSIFEGPSGMRAQSLIRSPAGLKIQYSRTGDSLFLMESSYQLRFGGLPTECYTAGLPAGLSSTCIEIWKVKGLNISTHMIKLVQSTMVPDRWSFKQTTAHMQHGHLVILPMALESHGVELSS